MKRKQKKILIRQLEKKIAEFSRAKEVLPPGSGWVHAIRTAIGMSLSQFGKRLNMTAQGARGIEKREADKSITLASLNEAAVAMDMQLVYGFIPKEETLEKMIEKRASEVAQKIVLRTAHTMHLEDQAIPTDDLRIAVEDKTNDIINEMPKYLWD
ncbi:MAG: mobile mystery protein A [Bacteroidota bacterium]